MLKQIRLELGLSQELVAGYLGISRSQLAMVEANRRELNSPEYVRFLSLYAQFTSKEKNKKGSKPASPAKNNAGKIFQQSIEKNLAERAYALAAAQRKLAKLDAKYQQASDLLQKIASFKAGQSVKDQHLVSIMESNAERSVSAASAAIQLNLRLRIRGLTAELKYLKQQKAKLKPSR